MENRLTLVILPGTYAVCRLPADAGWPNWAAGDFVSITRTADELSVVCIEDVVPPDVRSERGWRCLRVAGTLDFGAVGVLASLTGPLADAGISLFAVSTYETDYLLLPDRDSDRACAALRRHGHQL
ncbi:MAG TPA: ACT domain-containing protein [Gemmataceae bacterium]|nr:ACT domain-containing protein [Gemmataceae bacterium]